MTSRLGVKTYGRSQKVVCQSNIQFDQLFNEATAKNKPSAAKSTGTLHRWGMTSFTSLRNVEHGASGDGSGGAGNDDDDDHTQKKTIKRIKIAVDDDPFNFDAEPDSAKATYKVTQCVSSSNPSKTSMSSNSATAKVNKFFKSRASVPLSREKTVETAKVNRLVGIDKSRKATTSKPTKVLASFVNSDAIVRKTVPCDPLAAIVAAAEVSDVFFSPSIPADPPPPSTYEEDVRRHSVMHDYEAPPSSFTPVLSQDVVGSAPCVGGSGIVNYDSYLVERNDNHKEFNCEPIEKFYCPLETLQPPIFAAAAAAINVVLPTFASSSQESSSSYSVPLMTYEQSSQEYVPSIVESQSSSSEGPIELLRHGSQETLPPPPATISRLVPPLTIKLPPSVLNSVDFTDSGEDSMGSSIGQSTAALTSALKEIDEDSQKLKTEENHSSVIKVATTAAASTVPSPVVAAVPAAAAAAGTSKVFRSKPSLTRSASASFSVMRSRRIFNSPQKKDKKALYKHRPWQADEEHLPEVTDEQTSPVKEKTLVDEFDEFEEEEAVPFSRAGDEEAECEEPELEEETRPMLTRVVTWPTRIGDEAITSIRCPKKMKKLYTVVRNVKQAHQCHESGETQEFNDDIDYLLDGLQDANAVGTRCLSILSLAGKCMAASFRMHLRAHGTLTKVFSALHDAAKEPNLSLCTSTMMFVLSQDRLNMDLERESLELMLQLLDTETRSSDVAASAASAFTTNGHNNRDYDKNRHKVRELCEQLQKKGHAKHLDLDNITSGVLAMETLLSLTSRRAGEWFKEELRELGGLDHLVNTVSECGKSLPDGLFHLTEYALDKLRKLDRCLKVLENVTIMNVQNQSYLLTCQSSSLVYYCTRALKLCERSLLCYPTPDNAERDSPSWILFSCVLSILKVLLNLTNDNAFASTKVGEQEGLMMSTLACVLYVPAHLSVDQRFELLVLSLSLLINLVEHSELNRQKLFCTEVTATKASMSKTSPSKSTPNKHGRRGPNDIATPRALVNLFMEHEAAARLEEAKTDSLLDGKGDGESNAGVDANKEEGTAASQDDIEETLTKALQKAGKNMEDSMVAAYIALLLGCLIQDNRDNAAKVRDHLPSRDFDIMVKMLKKFLNFMHLTNVGGSTGMKSIQRVIDILEAT